MTSAIKNRMKDYQIAGLTMRLGRSASHIRKRLEVHEKTDIASRIFRKDATVWLPDRTRAGSVPELVDRLGWLEIQNQMRGKVEELRSFADEIRREGFRHVVLLGMGGSSLAPEVFMESFGAKKGYPALKVVDSTHPDVIKGVLEEIEMEKALFIVSSKSGTTLETSSLFKFFFGEALKALKDPGMNFIAITDPGTVLEKEAREKKFRRVFTSPKDIGGRYSALTFFGLVPAVLIGVDLGTILAGAERMAGLSRLPFPAGENPALVLGIVLGELALAGRNKLTFFLPREIASLGYWLEQLIAESTGKDNRGIVPVVDESFLGKDFYGEDRVFVFVTLKGYDEEDVEAKADSLEGAGHPVIHIEMDGKDGLGAEFYRWEMATAVIGSVLGINPFDQPDVESTKHETRKLMEVYKREGALPDIGGSFCDGRMIASHLEASSRGDYLCLMAYLAPSEATDKMLLKIRNAALKSRKIATTAGYGPRFLHSTGQLHKGDSGKGIYIQLTDEPASDLPIPGAGYSFRTLIRMQADADLRALSGKGRRVTRVHMQEGPAKGLERVLKAIS